MAAAQNALFFVYYYNCCYYDHCHHYHRCHRRTPIFGRNVVVD